MKKVRKKALKKEGSSSPKVSPKLSPAASQKAALAGSPKTAPKAAAGAPKEVDPSLKAKLTAQAVEEILKGIAQPDAQKTSTFILNSHRKRKRQLRYHEGWRQIRAACWPVNGWQGRRLEAVAQERLEPVLSGNPKAGAESRSVHRCPSEKCAESKPESESEGKSEYCAIRICGSSCQKENEKRCKIRPWCSKATCMTRLERTPWMHWCSLYVSLRKVWIAHASIP
eukprot:TRINITY_DN3642_c0_g1_i6.p1 TRINITY_DN3642_c0_g1~~TRINITY_DN3642_c0_g1_i6.p1  ORF type:complete len:226 (+),score=33.41 TRINITY_DN3642_c0_g1_i6:61-738(+)